MRVDGIPNWIALEALKRYICKNSKVDFNVNFQMLQLKKYCRRTKRHKTSMMRTTSPYTTWHSGTHSQQSGVLFEGCLTDVGCYVIQNSKSTNGRKNMILSSIPFYQSVWKREMGESRAAVPTSCGVRLLSDERLLERSARGPPMQTPVQLPPLPRIHLGQKTRGSGGVY